MGFVLLADSTKLRSVERCFDAASAWFSMLARWVYLVLLIILITASYGNASPWEATGFTSNSQTVLSMAKFRTQYGIYNSFKPNKMESKPGVDHLKKKSSQTSMLQGGNYHRPDISEFQLKNESHRYALITWTHFDSQVLYVLTCDKVKRNLQGSYCLGKSNIYKSTDYGTTFSDERNKFNNNSQINAVYTSPTDRNIVQVFDQQNQEIYFSTDEGRSYKSSNVSFSPLSVSFHPFLNNYILVKDTKNKVYITNDTGKNWYIISSDVMKSFWSYDQISGDSKIFLEVKAHPGSKFPKGNYTNVYTANIPFDGNVQLYRIDLGPIYQDSLTIKNNHMFIWRKTSSGNSRLFASFKGQPIKECVLPVNDLLTKFHIIDTNGEEIMLAALNASGWTKLFISDTTGTRFSLALTHIQASWSSNPPVIDLHIVNELPGTLLANQIGTGTLISYNKGGSWNSLKPPKKSYDGKNIECQLPDCMLQLSLNVRYSFAMGWAPVTSLKSVPGVIIAQGYLHYKAKGISQYASTYISNDGGETWNQILKGRQAVKMLDYGSIIAAIPFLNYAIFPNINRVYYSCDEGSSWRSSILSDKPKHLIGFAAHPAAKSSILTIFAVDIYSQNEIAWNVWKVNFTAVFQHKCYPENYTTWTASSNIATDACVLGQQYKYNRKKSEICCSNGLNYNPLVNASVCECTINDFRCDYGFQRENMGSLCVPTSFASLGPPINCPEGGQYVKTKGYVKVTGDRCEGGIEADIKPVIVQCPARAPDGLSLSVEKYSVALGKSALITLKQKHGFLNTKYTWDFGDEVRKYNLTYKDAKIQNHTYKTVGTYIIEVLAFNEAGSYTAKTVLRVIEKVTEVFLDVTKPVVAGEEAIYTVTVKSHGEQAENKHGFVHFAWIFEPIKTPILSMNSTVRYKYSKPGTYEVEVQVFNAISVVSTTITVAVFGDVRVIKLEFSSTLDLLNNGKPEWIKFFKSFIYDYLIRTFKIHKEMVEVDVSTTLPTIVTLSLVQNNVKSEKKSQSIPSKQASKQPIDVVMHAIVDRVRSRKITFFLFGQEIRVLSATIIRDKKLIPKKSIVPRKLSGATKKYLYIGIPIGVVFFVFLLCCCYRYLKYKFNWKSKTYQQMDDESDQNRL